MSLTVELVGICLVVPAAIAAFVAWSALRFDTARLAERFALPCSVAAAFIAACLILFRWAILSPERHWHWLPYLAAAAALIGPAGMTTARPAWVRWLVFLALAAGTAFLLVPTWGTLRPARPASMAILGIYLAILMVRIDRLPRNLSNAWLLATFTLTGFILAGVLADGSFRYAQLGLISAAAFAGCCLVVAVGRRESALNTRSLAPIFAVLIGGMAYVGCIEPEEPRWWLLIVPTLPLFSGVAVGLIKPYRASAGSAQSG